MERDLAKGIKDSQKCKQNILTVLFSMTKNVCLDLQLISLEDFVKMRDFSETFKEFEVIRNYCNEKYLPCLLLIGPPLNFNFTQVMDAVLV